MILRILFIALPLYLISAPPVYTRPGIVTMQGGVWEGSDHLLNLKGPLNVVVEILKPKNVEIPLSVETIENKIITEFKKMDLVNGNDFSSPTPGIPFFNVLIVAYPVEKGYVALVDARLMEVVDPYRVKLDPRTYFQAVTWEKKSVLVAPSDEFVQTVDKTVDDLVKAFLERVEYFQDLRRKLDQKDQVERLN
ncbi:MAG: hypothetical protein KDK62_04755 [Chlamydiia bacterium]|nr:hypothetical protein [Chlamydiia bacterium]